jgi:hypothetical protein
LQEWRWLTHAAILLCSSALLLVIDSIFDIGLFAFDVRVPGWLKMVPGTVALGSVLYLHLVKASPISRWLAATFAFAIPILALGTTGWVEERNQRRDVNFVQATPELFPPYLRLRSAKPIAGFFESAATLKGHADEKRRIAISEGEDEEVSGGD